MTEWVLILYLAMSPVPQVIPARDLSDCESLRVQLVAKTERTHKVRGSICMPRRDLVQIAGR
jgi:hypothetical protein